jgi:hypothetical protein
MLSLVVGQKVALLKSKGLAANPLTKLPMFLTSSKKYFGGLHSSLKLADYTILRE